MTDNTVHYYNHLLEVTQQALVRIRKKSTASELYVYAGLF